MNTERRVWLNDMLADLDLMEAALLKDTSVEDCALLVREAESCILMIVAYVVTNGPPATERLNSWLQRSLPDSPLPSLYVNVFSIPYTADGYVDEAALASLEVIDSDLARRWEARLRELPEVEQVAVVIEEQSESTPPLHLSDLIPEWRHALKPEPADSPATSISPPSEQDSNPQRLALSEGGLFWPGTDHPLTLQDAVKRAAGKAPDRGIVYVQPDGSEVYQSYSGLIEDAGRILSGLRKRGMQPREKVILQLERNDDFIPALWGCILGGFVPVPVEVAPTYEQPHSVLNKLHNTWMLLDRPVVLADGRLAGAVRALSEIMGMEGIEVESIEDLRERRSDHSWHAGIPDETALMLLTSGSTGVPKLVTLTHSNLLTRSAATSQVNRFSSDDITLNWFALDHSGGLIMFHIRDIYLGCSQIQVPTQRILQDPFEWLNLINKHRATITWAPNFAYGLINARIESSRQRHWDLSSMRFILNAGEAIVPRTIRRFMKSLSAYGLPDNAMRPEWGMSEICSTVTWSGGYSLSDSSDGDSFVNVGAPIPGTSIRIVDAQDRPIDEGQIGRVQVKGPTVTPGYYQSEGLNRQAFTRDDWFNTGDLGFLRDGNLTITGREKDIIIINGLNYFSHEIEAVVEEIEGVTVSYTAACATRDPADNTDKLIILFSPINSDEAQAVKLIKEIREKVVGSIGVNPAYLIPVEKRIIPKTEIGKIQRSQLRERFESGEFDRILKRIDVLSGNSNTLPDWFYVKAWRPRKIAASTAGGLASNCLIFLDQSGLGERLSIELRRAGAACVGVEAGDRFERLDSGRFRIDPAQREHYRLLIRSLVEERRRPDQVLHLWTYGERPCPATVSELNDALKPGVYSLLSLAQSLAEVSTLELPVGLLVISSRCQAVFPRDEIGFERAAMIGLLKTVANEFPFIACRHIDLPTEQVEPDARRILLEMKTPKKNLEVAYRNGQRLASRLIKAPLSRAQAQSLPFKRGGLYLISGGLGGAGAKIARYLIEHFSARLVLTGRTRLPDRSEWPDRSSQPVDAVSKRIANYIEIERLGGEVAYEAADVGDLEEMRAVVRRAESRFHRSLDGIIHLAGAFRERSLLDETADSLAEMLHAKAIGAWVLHQLVRDKPGLLFVNFSSVTAYFGGAAAGSFAAANSFLNGFTRYQRNRDGLQSYCFNWSMWDELGMSGGYQKKDLFRARGYHIMSPGQGLTSFLVGLCQTEHELIIGLSGESRHIRQQTGSPPLQEKRLSAYLTLANASMPQDSISAIALLDQFKNRSKCDFKIVPKEAVTGTGEIDRERLFAPLAMRKQQRMEIVGPRNEIEEEVAGIWQEVLGARQVSIYDNFFDLGGDSITATQFVSQVNRAFRVNLPQLSLYESPTIADIARFVETIEQIKQTSK